MTFMQALEVHHLRFTVQATTEVRFGPQAGAQLRGALWETLQTTIGDTDLLHLLMSYETPDGARGGNPARPFAIQPPLHDDPGADRSYPIGDTFCFGVSLFGTVIELFPYIVQAVYNIGQTGVGYGRGTFHLTEVQATNPLTAAHQSLLDGATVTALPGVPVTAEQVHTHSRALPQDQLSLQFLTPTQLTGHNKKLLSAPVFDRLIARLIDRCQTIEQIYAPVSTPSDQWKNVYLELTGQAKAIQMTTCQTQWVNVRSGSRRENTGKKISGFVGNVTYSGVLTPYLPWIVWGQSLQVGKNTVKGDGWYRLA